MILDINTIDSKLLAKIPLSIRLNLKDNLIDTDDLPLEVAYELRNIKKQVSNYTYVDNSTFDLKPSFSVYSDFTSINTKKEAVIEYIRNYLIVDKGNYPFDPTFGTLIKTYLQSLDTEPALISINQELTALVNVLKHSFQIPINISNASAERIDNDTSSFFKLNVKVQVSDITTSLNFEKTIDSYYLM